MAKKLSKAAQRQLSEDEHDQRLERLRFKAKDIARDLIATIEAEAKKVKKDFFDDNAAHISCTVLWEVFRELSSRGGEWHDDYIHSEFIDNGYLIWKLPQCLEPAFYTGALRELDKHLLAKATEAADAEAKNITERLAGKAPA